jgi:hypothetical protein
MSDAVLELLKHCGRMVRQELEDCGCEGDEGMADRLLGGHIKRLVEDGYLVREKRAGGGYQFRAGPRLGSKMVEVK